jgi:hypothetical protein
MTTIEVLAALALVGLVIIGLVDAWRNANA